MATSVGRPSQELMARLIWVSSLGEASSVLPATQAVSPRECCMWVRPALGNAVHVGKQPSRVRMGM